METERKKCMPPKEQIHADESGARIELQDFYQHGATRLLNTPEIRSKIPFNCKRIRILSKAGLDCHHFLRRRHILPF